MREEMPLDLRHERLCVTGGAGFVGRAVCAALRARGVPDSSVVIPRRARTDLRDERQVARLFDEQKPTVVMHLAAVVGGIGANQAMPATFFHDNMAMGLHLIEHARRAGVKRFVLAGTVCSYPKIGEVPFSEDALWSGYPEETNAPYGIAKKSLMVMLDACRRQYGLSSAVVVPTNLYGPHDNFDPATSHVIPALIRKAEDARRKKLDHITCWGSGTVTREFLYVDDAAEAIVRAAERIDEPSPINLGTGHEISIRDLAATICRQCGYDGCIDWDISKPDGQPRRCLDVSRAHRQLDWRATTPLESGLRTTIEWFRAEKANQ